MERPGRLRRRQFLIARGETDVDSWYRTHFASRKVSVESTQEIAGLYAEAMECHLTNVRPDDSVRHMRRWPEWVGVCEDEAMEDFWDEMSWWFQNHRRRYDRSRWKALSLPFEDIQTVGDLLECCDLGLSIKPIFVGRRDDDVGDG